MLGDGTNQKSSFFFAQQLDIADLLYVNIKLAQTQTASPYPPQVIKCRELIFTEPDILASPVYGNEAGIQIVLQKTLYKNGKFVARLVKMNLEVSSPHRVVCAVLQACLSYTLQARLAPAWCKAGPYFIQGRDFLTEKGKLNAIEAEFIVSEDQIMASMRTHSVRLPAVQLADLGVSSDVLRRFASSREAVIPEYSIQDKWCHIAPSLKKGQVINICHTIPKDSPFSNYKDIKKYWKNMYGYRLPETDSGMLYFQVYFKPIGHKLFTYPQCCLRGQEALPGGRVDGATVLGAFLADLTTRVPRICGQTLRFSPDPRYATPNLSTAAHSQVSSSQPRLNLTQTAPLSVERQRAVGVPAKPTFRPVTTIQTSSSTPQISNGNMPSYQKNPISSTPTASELSISSQSLPQLHGCLTTSQGVPAVPSGSKVRPVFLPKKISGTYSQPRAISSLSAAPKTVPNFRPKPIQKPTVVPCSQPAPLPASKYATDDTCAIFTSQNSTNNPTFQNRPRPTTAAPTFGSAARIACSSNSQQSLRGLQPSLDRPPHAISKIQQHPLITKVTATSGSQYGRSPKSTLQKKRPLEDVTDASAKKMKAKPKVQEGVDVPQLAYNNMLAKVNTATLQSWLKQRGVGVTSRDKKSLLVEKVCRELKLPNPQAAEQ